jgi:hypothetical protein
MKITMKRGQVPTVLQALIGISAKQEKVVIGKEEKLIRANWPVWFQYFLKRNQDILMSFVRNANKQGMEKTQVYDLAREEINKRYARLDAGEPIIVNGNYDIPEESMKAYNDEQLELRKTHAAIFEDLKKFDAEEVELEVHMLNMSKVENLELPAGSFDLIQPLINLEA